MLRRAWINIKLWIRSLNAELGSMDDFSRKEVLDLITKETKTMQNTIQIPWDVYEELLDDRREAWEGWGYREIPECIWDWVLELLRETGGLPDPGGNDPRYIVDNLVVNGSWEDFEDLRRHYAAYSGMTDDEIADSIEEEGSACAVFREERLVLWNTGL